MNNDSACRFRIENADRRPLERVRFIAALKDSHPLAQKKRVSLDSVPLSLIWDESRSSSQLAAFRRQVDAAYPPYQVRRSRKTGT